ncbi:ParB N-terminal domain-containing protein [Isoptericola sp. NPDC056134]|uniref:ParB N-terminal domain-containing protein n=1 Tax=Isoptericola sp. NPDC056134 TaxID=3345723 RepID=UPI0035E49B89
MARGVVAGNVRLDLIQFHPHNVRVDLGDLRDLAASIKEFGVLAPVVLEQRGEMLRVRNGHRRVAAARNAGLERIPAGIARDVSMSEHLVRRILNPPPVELATPAVEKPKRPSPFVSVKRIRNDLDEARTAVAAGELDALGVLNRIEALLPEREPAKVGEAS